MNLIGTFPEHPEHCEWEQVPYEGNYNAYYKWQCIYPHKNRVSVLLKKTDLPDGKVVSTL